MTNTFLNLAGSLLFAVVCTTATADSLSYGPFQGVDLQALGTSDRLTIVEASEDFEAVKSGKPPKHAKLDRKAERAADGGTAFYLGRRYKLTVVKSLSSFASLDGYVYGPVITFEESFAPGNASAVSDLRFYTAAQLKALLQR